MKHIKLFETWQWHSQEEEDTESERELVTTVGEILDWAAGPDWIEDPEALLDILMVDGDWPDQGSWLGYHELLKRSRSEEIQVLSQDLEGQIQSDWILGGMEWSLISDDWPFEESDSLDPAETRAYLRLLDGLGPELEEMGAGLPDLIDWVRRASGLGLDLDGLSPTGFKNWFWLQRSGAN